MAHVFLRDLDGSRRSSRTRFGWVKPLQAIGLAAVLLGGGLNYILADRQSVPSPAQVAPAEASVAQPKQDDGLWDGPVLFHDPADLPLDLILVEKSAQKLHLYRYDGLYHLVKTYACGTGEQQGQKRQEKDEKTPEGIYFSTRSFRDSIGFPLRSATGKHRENRTPLTIASRRDTLNSIPLSPAPIFTASPFRAGCGSR